MHYFEIKATSPYLYRYLKYIINGSESSLENADQLQTTYIYRNVHKLFTCFLTTYSTNCDRKPSDEVGLLQNTGKMPYVAFHTVLEYKMNSAFYASENTLKTQRHYTMVLNNHKNLSCRVMMFTGVCWIFTWNTSLDISGIRLSNHVKSTVHESSWIGREH